MRMCVHLPGNPATRHPATRQPGNPSQVRPHSLSSAPVACSARMVAAPGHNDPGDACSARMVAAPGHNDPGDPTRHPPGNPATRQPGNPAPGHTSSQPGSHPAPPGNPATRQPGNPALQPGNPAPQPGTHPATRQPGLYAPAAAQVVASEAPAASAAPAAAPVFGLTAVRQTGLEQNSTDRKRRRSFSGCRGVARARTSRFSCSRSSRFCSRTPMRACSALTVPSSPSNFFWSEVRAATSSPCWGSVAAAEAQVQRAKARRGRARCMSVKTHLPLGLLWRLHSGVAGFIYGKAKQTRRGGRPDRYTSNQRVRSPCAHNL